MMKLITAYQTESGEVPDGGLEVIISNCLLAIVAGSDTSSSAMSNAFYFLLSHPDKYRKLQEEIDNAYNTHQIPDLDVESDEVQSYHDVLAGLKYLNAVMYVVCRSESVAHTKTSKSDRNETLRLVPSIGTGLQRAPSKGSGGHMLTGGDSKLNMYVFVDC